MARAITRPLPTALAGWLGAAPRLPRTDAVRSATQQHTLRAMGALGGEWEDWCSNGGADRLYAGNLDLCLRRNYSCALPGCLLAPWTVVGQESRWMSHGLNVDPSDFDPENFAYTAINDVPRAIYLSTVWGVLPPGARTFFKLPEIACPPDPVLAVLCAFPTSLARGKAEGAGNNGWDRVWDKLLQPLLTHSWEGFLALVNTGFSLPGFYANRVLNTECKSNRHAPQIRAMHCALANYGNLFKLATKPELIKEDYSLREIGDLMVKAADSLQNANDKSFVKTVGKIVFTYATPISVVLKQGTAGVPEALDDICEIITGIKFTRLTALVSKAGGDFKAAASNAIDQGESLKDAQTSSDAINSAKGLGDALDGMVKAFNEIPWPVLQNVGKFLSDAFGIFVGVIKGRITTIEQFVAAANGQPIPSTGSAGGGGGTHQAAPPVAQDNPFGPTTDSRGLTVTTGRSRGVTQGAQTATGGGGAWWALGLAVLSVGAAGVVVYRRKRSRKAKRG